MSAPRFEVCELLHPTPQMSVNLGLLMTHLSDGNDGSPPDVSRTNQIIASPDAAWLVARAFDEDLMATIDDHSRLPIIGSMVLSTDFGSLESGARLQDFVVAPEAQGKGVAQKMWETMERWRYEHGLKQMTFTSNPVTKARAHGFYLKNGCRILAEGDTTVFVHDLGDI